MSCEWYEHSEELTKRMKNELFPFLGGEVERRRESACVTGVEGIATYVAG